MWVINMRYILALSLWFTACIPCQAFMLIAGRSGGADAVAPHVTTVTVNADALVINYDEAVTQGAGYAAADIDVDCSTTGANLAVTYVSGNGTSSHSYTLASPAVNGETCDLDFNGDADSLEDAAGNDLAAIVSGANNTPAAGDPDPDIEYELDDNAANTTVEAAFGSSGTYRVITTATNTDTTHSATAISGTGSFKLPDGGNVYSNVATLEDDGVFTIQVTFMGDGAGSQSAYPRLIDTAVSNGITLYRYGSDTTLRLYLGATFVGDITVDDIADSQWHQLRLICDSGAAGDDVSLYQRTYTGSWGAWTLKDSFATFTTPSVTSTTFYGGAAGTNSWGSSTNDYYGDDVKVWGGAVYP